MKIPELENALKLSARVAVYVPGTVDVKTTIDPAEYVKATAAEMSAMFGGATAQSVAGYWMSDNDGLIEEKTTIVYSYSTPEVIAKNAGAVLDLCRRIKETMKQEAVSLEIDNELYLI